MAEKETLVERYRRLKSESESMVEAARKRLVEIEKERVELEKLIGEAETVRMRKVMIGQARRDRRETLNNIIASFEPGGRTLTRHECLEKLRAAGYKTPGDENLIDNQLCKLMEAGKIRRIGDGRYVVALEKTQHPANPAPQPGEAPLTKLMEDEQ